MPRPTHTEGSYLPGLDGIRAIAVVVVLLYHLQVPGFSGGLLGVGVFFTLSGFLITSLLVSAHERNGHLGLKTFWIRRARRLIPAVVLVLVATLATTAVVVPEKLGEYAGEAASALFYVNNWHTILASGSYFDRFDGPSPLSHMWSLSIEEQFYIAWPLLLGLAFAVVRRRRLISLLTVGLALGSFYLLATLATPGLDNTRAYEGTDTRAGALLLGAALALWWPARVHRVSTSTRKIVDALGLAGLAVVIVLCVQLPDGSMDLYRWGIAALTVATLCVLVAAVTPSTLVAGLLSIAPLRWIGERSYGIYLWHMPLVAFLPGIIRTGSTLVSSIVVIVATCVIASISWRYVEDPIRRHGFAKALTTPRLPEDTMRAALLTTLISGVTGVASALERLRNRIGDTPRPGGRPNAPETPPPVATEPQAPRAYSQLPDRPAAVTVWDSAPSPTSEPAPLHEEPVDVSGRRPLIEEVVVTTAEPPVDDDTRRESSAAADSAPSPGGAAEPSAAQTRRFRIPTEVTVLSSAPKVLDLPAAEPSEDPDQPADDTPTVRTAAAASTPDPAPPAEDDPQPAGRSPVRAALVTLTVLALAVGTLIGVSRLQPDLPIVNALYSPQTPGSALDDDSDDTQKPAARGPRLPADERRTRCETVVHVGDSTSIGMNDASLQPNPALRLVGQYTRVGATKYVPDVVGGRSSMERLNDEPNATESIRAALARGVRGCWVMAMGINDTANVEVGGLGPVDMRIDNLLEPLRGQPVLWPTVITGPLNENPAYDNRAMQNFNRALIRACKRYPDLRVYDWAGEVKPEWFADGVHYTEAGYVERARRFAVALATQFPARDLPPAGCLLKSTSAVVSAP